MRFGLPLGGTSQAATIYDLPMTGEPKIILDSHRPVQNSSQPLCAFWSTDIDAAHDHLRILGVEILGAVEDIGSVRTLTFRDPDRNLLMICQRNARCMTVLQCAHGEPGADRVAAAHGMATSIGLMADGAIT